MRRADRRAADHEAPHSKRAEGQGADGDGPESNRAQREGAGYLRAYRAGADSLVADAQLSHRAAARGAEA